MAAAFVSNHCRPGPAARTRLVWADTGGPRKPAVWATTLPMTVQIVAERDRHAFQILPHAWWWSGDLRLDQRASPYRLCGPIRSKSDLDSR